MKCAITGSSGYVGSSIRETLKKAGNEVVALQRQNTPTPFKLGTSISQEYFLGVDALIHCAYDFSARNWVDIHRINVSGSVDLFSKAIASGVKKLIFISSISAYETCRSLYGRAKLEVETFVLANGGYVIRPGLIYGDTPGGMVGSLLQAVTKPIVPVVGGNQEMFLVHEADLCALILQLLVQEELPKSAILAAHPKPWKFSNILSHLAKKQRANPFFVPLPWRIVWLGLRCAELLGMKLGFRSDSLLSLAYPNPTPDFSIAQQLGVKFRPF